MLAPSLFLYCIAAENSHAIMVAAKMPKIVVRDMIRVDTKAIVAGAIIAIMASANLTGIQNIAELKATVATAIPLAVATWSVGEVDAVGRKPNAEEMVTDAIIIAGLQKLVGIAICVVEAFIATTGASVSVASQILVRVFPVVNAGFFPICMYIVMEQAF